VNDGRRLCAGEIRLVQRRAKDYVACGVHEIYTTLSSGSSGMSGAAVS